MDIFCVMGNPVEHSKSPWIHQQFAEQLKIPISYTTRKPEIGHFKEMALQFRAEGGRGFNITIPFKEDAYQFATELSPRAKIAKAVNTIMFLPNGKISGDNTDGFGLMRDIKQNLQYSLTKKIIVIFGAGGAVRGILHPILAEAPQGVIIANRTLENAEQLVREFQVYGNVRAVEYNQLAQLTADVVIDGTGFNATLSIPDSLVLAQNALCYDLKYSNEPTAFMQWAQKNEATIIKDGLGMLIEQAAEAFFIWTGKKPSTAPVLQEAKKLFYKMQC